MRIPKNDIDRAILYAQVSNDCLRSKDDRVTEYVARESYYLFGSATGSPPADHNKIYASIQTLASFLYAAESTAFTLEMAANARNVDLLRVPPVSKILNNTWLGSDSDACAAQCVEWALVYGTMLMKTIWRDGQFRSYPVRPHDFGVYEEDKTSIDDQDALVHCYYISKPALERTLEGHPKRAQIMDGVSMIGKTEEKPKSGLDRLILTASSPITPANPNMTGALSTGGMQTPPNYDAVLQTDLVEMRELWIWNDEEHDYQIVTQAGDITVFDRLCGTLTKQGQMFPKGENPFTSFVPTPKYNYFWGISDVGRVQNLQDLFTKRMSELDDLLAKQVNPPRHAIGFTEEQILALSFVGGRANTQDPMSKVELLTPQIPPQLLNSIEMIEDGFAEALALHNILQGKGEPGVRGRGHAQELARLSSARIKRKALNIEDSLEKVGTLMLKVLKLNDATELPDETTQSVFLLDNFTSDCTVKVDAHSNSPLFAEDLKALAGELLEAGIIDGESFIDLVKPPMADLLKMKLKLKMQQEQAQNQQQQQQGEQGG
jgi:hypothetical protein